MLQIIRTARTGSWISVRVRPLRRAVFHNGLLGRSRRVEESQLYAISVPPLHSHRARTLRELKADWIELHGVTGHNLSGADIRLPLHAFTAISGVPGSGKTTVLTASAECRSRPTQCHRRSGGRRAQS